MLPGKARDDVGAAAGWVGDDQLHRSCRIALRPSGMRERRRRRSARCELQEPSTVKRHGVSPNMVANFAGAKRRFYTGRASRPEGHPERKPAGPLRPKGAVTSVISALGVRCRAGTLANKSRFAKNRHGALVFGPLPSLWPILLFLDSSSDFIGEVGGALLRDGVRRVADGCGARPCRRG